MKVAIKIIPMLSVFIYLCVGIIWKCWHPGWLIIVGGGVLTAILKAIESSRSEKNSKPEENNPKE